MSDVREPAVSGLFYPADPTELSANVRALLDSVKPRTSCFKALISPHAGYIYSGPIAAEVFASLLARSEINRVVLFGPSHRVPLTGMAVPSSLFFNTPLGPVRLDHDSIQKILTMSDVSLNDEAHAWEHSLEVQLPFLQEVLADFTLVPVVVGYTAPESVAQVMQTLWGGDETLILVSSDLSHFLPYAQAQRVDRTTSDKILAKTADLSGEEACGCYAVNGLLTVCRKKGLKGKMLALANSGDTAGDKNRVVGYGGYGFK
ncbi:MAG: AmmeMemoRadiSam system protein B [Gammaproteobacteria bacterium]|nr:MAG: AmmeMemoRadiSam system protein B [Gammaproteobacteria bacterium]